MPNFTTQLVKVYKEMVDQTISRQNFLQNFFTPVQHESSLIQINVERNNRSVARDVVPGESEVNALGNHTEDIYTPFDYNIVTPIAVESGRIRTVTETEYSNRTISDRTIERILESIMYSTLKISRAYEKQCSDALLTGMIVPNAAGKETVNFNRKSTHSVTLTGTATWDGTAADIVGNLTSWAQITLNDGKESPTRIIMGKTAYNAFIDDDSIKGQLDQRWNDTITRRYIEDPNGAAFMGRVAVAGAAFEIWTYPQVYWNGTTHVQYIPDNEIIMLPANPNFTAAYGAVATLADVNTGVYSGLGLNRAPSMMPEKYVATVFADEQKQVINTRVQSRGLMVPVAIDTIFHATVLAA